MTSTGLGPQLHVPLAQRLGCQVSDCNVNCCDISPGLIGIGGDDLKVPKKGVIFRPPLHHVEFLVVYPHIIEYTVYSTYTTNLTLPANPSWPTSTPIQWTRGGPSKGYLGSSSKEPLGNGWSFLGWQWKMVPICRLITYLQLFCQGPGSFFQRVCLACGVCQSRTRCGYLPKTGIG